MLSSKGLDAASKYTALDVCWTVGFETATTAIFLEEDVPYHRWDGRNATTGANSDRKPRHPTPFTFSFFTWVHTADKLESSF